jgi:glucokinase
MFTHTIGVDFGGTGLKAGLVDCQTGAVTGLVTAPTLSQEGPRGVMGRMADLVEAIANTSGMPKSQIGGVGIGVPGEMDMERGVTKFLPNLPGNWPEVPLAETITSLTGFRVQLLNDVRAITYGEWQFGAGQGVTSMACFAIGTGIGGGLVINNQLVLGIGGTAGELGHITVDDNGPLCGCGNHGCVEAYASGPAIAALGLKAVTQGLTTRIGEMAGYDLNKITPELIAHAAQEGDTLAQQIYQQAGHYLGVAVANVLVSVGPRKVVIGGGVARAGDLLLDPVRQTIRERVRMMPVDQVQVVPASLGVNAGIMGSAVWASHRLAAQG